MRFDPCCAFRQLFRRRPAAHFALIAVSPAQAQSRDMAGARDYPGIGRFAGSVITGYAVKDFDAARMQAAASRTAAGRCQTDRGQGDADRLAHQSRPRSWKCRAISRPNWPRPASRPPCLQQCRRRLDGPFNEARSGRRWTGSIARFRACRRHARCRPRVLGQPSSARTTTTFRPVSRRDRALKQDDRAAAWPRVSAAATSRSTASISTPGQGGDQAGKPADAGADRGGIAANIVRNSRSGAGETNNARRVQSID